MVVGGVAFQLTVHTPISKTMLCFLSCPQIDSLTSEVDAYQKEMDCLLIDNEVLAEQVGEGGGGVLRLVRL
jgi:hypothetical protein